jgi:soluble lytic murein transglycosylase-like protein
LTWWYILPASTTIPATPTQVHPQGFSGPAYTTQGQAFPLTRRPEAAVSFSTASVLGQETPAGPERRSAHFKPSQNDTQYDAIIVAASRAHGVPPQLLKSLLVQESDLRPNVGENHASAAGIAQFTRETAPRWGLRVSGGIDERLVPEKAIPAAARYLAHFYQEAVGKGFQGMAAWQQALIAYNAGPARMGRPFDQLPSETRKYITQVPERAQGIRVAGYNA